MQSTDQTEQPITESTILPNPTLQAEESAAHNKLQVILLITGAIILSGASYYLGTLRNQQSKVAQLQQSPDSIQVSQTATVDTENTAEWKPYTVNELRIGFKLPKSFAKYGEFKETAFGGDGGGTQVCATFMKQTSYLAKQVYAGGGSCTANKFGIGTTSVEFSAAREGGFADYQGFIVKNNIYYAKAPINKEWEISQHLVSKVENSDGLEIIKVKGAEVYSDAMEMYVEDIGTPGKGKIGALINTHDINYPGFTIEMELSDELTEEVFDKILESLHTVK